MNLQTLQWAVFCAVLVPLVLRGPSDPIAETALHIGLAFGFVALADWRERNG